MMELFYSRVGFGGKTTGPFLGGKEEIRGEERRYGNGPGRSLSDMETSDVIPRALLQLNKPPSSSVRVIDILGCPRHSDGIIHQLHFIFHARGQLIRLRVAVHMHLLRAGREDEDRDSARLEHARCRDIHVPDVEDTAV